MPEQELFQEGLSAFRSGNRKHAIAILTRLVQEHPRSERGWFLLGMCMDTADKREYCFQRVLDINPNNADAKKQIAFLSTPQPVSPTQPFSQPSQNTPAFISEDKAPQTKTSAKKTASKKKTNNNIILIAALSGLCILVCVGVLGFRMLTNRPGTSAVLSATNPNSATSNVTPNTQPDIANTLPPATQLPTALPTVAYTPAFEEAPCQFEIPFGVQVTCGYAIVPENRSIASGRTLRLAVAVYHSTSSNPAPDPVLFLQGGPGGQAVQLSANAYSILVEPFISTRDYVTFDQRGTGLSEPVMNCDELDKVHRQDIYGTLAVESRELVYQNAFLSCSGLLQAQGSDLSAYSTVESAADLRDIVKLLGYQQVNLYGASYGTRLALVTMRNHPEIIRSAVLDSVVPVEANMIEEYPKSVNAALSQLFIACASDPACGSAYPDLEAVFRSLLQKLDARPITLTTSAYPMGTVTETVDGAYLLSVITGLLRSPDFILTAPQTIYRVENGDYSTLIAAQYSLPYEFDGISPGLYISMMCREHVLDSTPEELKSVSEQTGIKEKVFRPFYGDFADMFPACKNWGSTGPNLGENDAVVSDIPSLVIEGSFDPATPPFLGKQVAETLTHSYYFEFPTMGHVPTADDLCARQTMLAFIANPGIEPSRECLNGIQPVKFLVPFTGQPPLNLERQSLSGVTLDVPRDWSLTDDGFFLRESSAFDITQVTAFRSDVSPQELVDYFSSGIHGYRGLDGPPNAAGTRQANGYLWMMYYTTSNGRPVDIAVADDGGESLVIVLFSHPDEHDALYRSLLLPMIDSAR